jgi:hypothetical protein
MDLRTRPAEAHALAELGVDLVGVLVGVGDGTFSRERSVDQPRLIFAAITSPSKRVALLRLTYNSSRSLYRWQTGRKRRSTAHCISGHASGWEVVAAANFARLIPQNSLDSRSDFREFQPLDLEYREE